MVQKLNSKSLEEELREKPDWKQWLPVVGIYYINEAKRKSLSSIRDFNEGHLFRDAFAGLYHGITLGVVAGCALYDITYGISQLGKIVEKLF